ncbi:MAG TPA: PqqD family protein [Alphaproteobacteria bacterium]|jgi:hypothetical protein|nr:PqqD family protein [Alphaproteobacteria bacterium]
MRYAPSGPEVIMQDFGDETVVANLESGLFYSLTGSAIPLWAWIAEGASTDSLAERFIVTEDVPLAGISDAIEGFVTQLTGEGLIAPATDTPAPTASPAPIQFAKPGIERFDDLQGLLLVDPIHDVGPQGWPLRPND